MPSPLAHGAVAAALAALDRAPAGRWRARALALWGLANAADLDFVPGVLTGDPVAFHHGASHSIAVAITLALAGAWAVARGDAGFRAMALTAALSHPLLDYATGEPGADVARYGVALGWPWPARYMAASPVFGAYHIDTMGLFGGVLTRGAAGPLARELGFALVSIGLAVAWRARRPESPG